MSLWQNAQPQRHTPRGQAVVPFSGRPINLTHAEQSYPGRWHT